MRPTEPAPPADAAEAAALAEDDAAEGDASADRATLQAGARDAVARIAAVARREGKKAILTEIGYAARAGVWTAPTEGEGSEHDPADQRLAYEVFFQALGRPDWLAGLFLWKTYSHPDSSPGDPFQFLGRPAQEVIRAYFRGESSAVPASE